MSAPAEVKLLREPYNQLVDVLEDLLKQAKTGELRALAYAIISPGSHFGTGWALSDDINIHVMMSSVTVLNYRFTQFIAENGEDD